MNFKSVWWFISSQNLFKSTLLWVLLLSASVVQAQESIEHYLRVTDEVREGLRISVVRYVREVRSLDQKENLEELQSLSGAYESTWRTLLETVENTTPPGEAELYHRTLRRSLQLQLEIPKLFAEIMGAEESRDDLKRSVQAVRTDLVELNKLLDQERKRLLQIVTDETSS